MEPFVYKQCSIEEHPCFWTSKHRKEKLPCNHLTIATYYSVKFDWYDYFFLLECDKCGATFDYK